MNRMTGALLALTVLPVAANAAPLCLQPAANAALVHLALSHEIDRALPTGWSLAHVEADRAQVVVQLLGADRAPRTLTLLPSDAVPNTAYDVRLPANLPEADTTVLRNVAATIIEATPPDSVGSCDATSPPSHPSTGPQPWSRGRALSVAALAALALLGALVFVALGGTPPDPSDDPRWG